MAGAVTVIHPRSGDILNRNDGVESDDGLRITVRGRASGASPVTVNGVPARIENSVFSCDVVLKKKRNCIVAACGDARHEIEVWWNRRSRKRYRFSVDDNILFLKDFGLHSGEYASLFDHWYMGFWRQMHVEHGTKVHINIYYQTQGFDLTQMPDKWKDEWEANVSWLHLSFHALQDAPERPYRNARYPQMAHDYALVCGHIRRFAGNEVLSATTTVHWAECPRDAALALRDRGIEHLVGLFDAGEAEGPPTTGYYLSAEQCRYCDTRGAWRDTDTGLTFIRCTAVVNALRLDDVERFLDARTATPHTGEIVELLIHEQYFRKELPYYQPDAMDKVRAALQWAAQRGYEPVFWSDGFLGTRG